MKLKALVPLFVFAGLVIAFGFGLTRDPSLLPSEMIDRPFPAFELKDLYTEDMVTEEVFKNEVSLVNVFGSWCVSCEIEHPKLMELGRNETVRLIGVDWRDTEEKGKRWLARNGNPYDQVIFDGESRLAIDLGVTGAPESFLVDPSGNIRYKHVGIITDEVWSDILEPIVNNLRIENTQATLQP